MVDRDALPDAPLEDVLEQRAPLDPDAEDLAGASGDALPPVQSDPAVDQAAQASEADLLDQSIPVPEEDDRRE